MRKQYRTFIVLAVAVVTAGLAAFGVARVLQNMPVREVEVANTQVVVAAAGIPVGTRLQVTDLRIVAWPSRNQVAGAFSDPQEIVNRGVIVPIAENEPITERKLAPLEAGAGLSPLIPDGMRALAVRVNDVVGVAGFILPGSRVDVAVTTSDPSSNNEQTARVIVSNVEVLGAGTSLDQEAAKDGEPVPVSVVTLSVVPEDAEKITLAQNDGQITLMLRNMLDTKPTETKGVKKRDLLREPNPVPEVDPNRNRVVRPRVAAAPEPKPYLIETIKAGERETKELK